MSLNPSKSDKSNKENEDASTTRKRQYKTLNQHHYSIPNTKQPSSKRKKLTQLNNTNDTNRPPLPTLSPIDIENTIIGNAACDQKDSEEYEFEKIVTDRPSTTKPGQKQYLIHWKGYELADASWNHATSITNPSAVEKYEKLAISTKRKRIREYNKAIQIWQQQHNDEKKFEDKAIQCEIIEDEDEDEDVESSQSIELLSTDCDIQKKHWPKLTKHINDLNLIWNTENIKIFLIIMTQFALFVGEHQNCDEQVEHIKDKLKNLYEFLITLRKIEIIEISDSDSNDGYEQLDEQLDDKSNDATSDTTGSTIAESSVRSQASEPGLLSQKELTPDPNAASDGEYIPPSEPEDDDDSRESDEADEKAEYLSETIDD